MKKNNNISTIYHDRHDQLKLLAGSPAKAEFLSKLLFWWQISKYKIKNSDHIWFTRTTDELAAGTGLSESSVGRYLRDFSKKNLIEKRVLKRYSKKHAQDIACLHIRITEKLLALLKTNTTAKPSTTNQTEQHNKNTGSKNLSHIDDTPSLNLTDHTSNNKGGYLNNNTVNQSHVNYVTKKPSSSQKTFFAIEKEIGERVTVELKERVKGMLFNVLKDLGEKLEHHEKLFAEVIFSVTNDQQFKGLQCMTKKINSIAKLIRNKQWRTPKGFYNHWDVGQTFKDREEINKQKLQREKLDAALEGVTDPQKRTEIITRLKISEEYEAQFNKTQRKINHTKWQQPTKSSNENKLKDKLGNLIREIKSETQYLALMENAFKQGLSYASKEFIDKVGIKIAELYNQKHEIEQQLQNTEKELTMCA